MGRGSYAKRLTGQMARTMPVLKPTIPLFNRGITSEFMAARLERDSLLPGPQLAREKPPEPFRMAPTSSTAPSEQATPKPARRLEPAFRPKPDLQESQFLNPPSTRVADLAGKVEIIEPKEAQRLVKPDVPKAHELPGNVKVKASEGPKIDPGIPSFHASERRVNPSRPQEQKEIIESRAVIPKRTSAQRRAPVSFLNSGHAKEPIEKTTTATSQAKSSAIPSIEPPSIELHKPSRKSQRSEKSAQELQPRKNPIEKQALAAVMQFESRGPQDTAQNTAARRQQEPRGQTAGGVHIGSLEVRIMPPAAPAPIIKPQQARQAPATVLSRSLTSSLGLSQG